MEEQRALKVICSQQRQAGQWCSEAGTEAMGTTWNTGGSIWALWLAQLFQEVVRSLSLGIFRSQSSLPASATQCCVSLGVCECCLLTMVQVSWNYSLHFNGCLQYCRMARVHRHKTVQSCKLKRKGGIKAYRLTWECKRVLHERLDWLHLLICRKVWKIWGKQKLVVEVSVF